MILAAGRGERLRPLTDAIPKALVNVAGKTLLEWAIDRYNKSGISEIVVAIGWKGQMIEEFVSKSGFKVNIVHVPEYGRGPLQTLLAAIDLFEGDFLLSPVDAIIEPTSMIGMQTLNSLTGDPEVMTLAIGSDIESGTLVEFSDEGFITAIGNIKSTAQNVAPSAMLLIANTRIRESCRSALDDGMERVAELLEKMIQDGSQVRCYDTQAPWYDVDTLHDILVGNQHLLQRGGFIETDSVFIPFGDSIEVGDSLSLKSNITIGKGTSLQGPVLIRSNCQVDEDCILGPNVTIASETSLSKGCEVTNAVIFGESKVASRSRVHRSVIYNSIEYNAEG